MKTYVETFNRLKDLLESSVIEINYVGFWMRNLERSINGGGFQFKDKAVYIEFPLGQVAQDGTYHQYFLGELNIRVHVITDRIDENYPESLLYAQQVHELLAHQSYTFPSNEGGFSELKLSSIDHDLPSKNKYDVTYTYTTNLQDATTSRDKKQVQVQLKQVINKDIIDNG